jgi:hypothetical protein
MCLAQQPVANYRVSTNTNNSNKTAQDKKKIVLEKYYFQEKQP